MWSEFDIVLWCLTVLSAYCPLCTVALKPPGWRCHRAWARHRCSQLYLLLLLFFSKVNRILEGLNVLENSWNFAHASEVVKIYVCYGFRNWAWQNGSIAPSNVQPRSLHNTRGLKFGTHIYQPSTYKKFSWSEIRNQTGSQIFWINSPFLAFSRRCTLTNSS